MNRALPKASFALSFYPALIHIGELTEWPKVLAC